MSKKQQPKPTNVAASKSNINTQAPAASVVPKDFSRFWQIAQIALVVIAFGFTYQYVFDHKVSVNGDNAGYYLLGKSINAGDGYCYMNDLTKRATDTFPPGYPFLLSIFMFFSKDIAFLSIVNGFFFLGSLLLLIPIFRRMSIQPLVGLAAILLSLCNYHIASYSFTTMSEIPYLFFSLLSIYLLLITDFSQSVWRNPRFWGMILCIVLTYQIRSLGVALMGAVVFYLLFEKKWKEALTVFAIVVMAAMPWMIRGKMLNIPSAYREALIKVNPYKPELGNVDSKSLLARVDSNVRRYAFKEIPSGMYPAFEINYKQPPTDSTRNWGIALLLLMIGGIVALPSHRLLIFAYMGATFLILMLWPEVWFGTRFMMPLLPIMILLVLQAVYWMLNWVTKRVGLDKPIVASAVTLAMAVPVLNGYIKQPVPLHPEDPTWQTYPLKRLNQMAILDYQPNWKNFFDIATWSKDSIPAKAVVACRKPELYHVFSDKYTCYYPYEEDDAKFMAYLKENKVTHIVVEQLGFSSTGRYLVPFIQRHQQKFRLLKQLPNPDTYIFEWLPDAPETMVAPPPPPPPPPPAK